MAPPHGVGDRSPALTAEDLQGGVYQLLFQRSPRPGYVFDRTGFGFLDVNDAALDLYGYDRETFLRMTALEIRPPEDIPRLLAAIRSDAIDLGVWRHHRRDGSTVWVEIRNQRIRWSENEAQLVTIFDVSAREQARHETERANERYRLIFDRSPVGIVAADHDFTILDVNPAMRDLLGYSLEQLREMTFLDFTYPPDRDVDAELAHRLLSGEIPHYSLDKRYVRSDGVVIWVHLTAYVIHDDAGDIAYGMGIVQDITERKRREDETAEEAHRASRLLATLTAREREILDLASGMTAREMAGVLTISPRTAETHLASAYRKLEVTGREAAADRYRRLVQAADSFRRSADPLSVPYVRRSRTAPTGNT